MSEVCFCKSCAKHVSSVIGVELTTRKEPFMNSYMHNGGKLTWHCGLCGVLYIDPSADIYGSPCLVEYAGPIDSNVLLSVRRGQGLQAKATLMKGETYTFSKSDLDVSHRYGGMEGSSLCIHITVPRDSLGEMEKYVVRSVAVTFGDTVELERMDSVARMYMERAEAGGHPISRESALALAKRP